MSENGQSEKTRPERKKMDRKLTSSKAIGTKKLEKSSKCLALSHTLWVETRN